jgi:hypothetical protein
MFRTSSSSCDFAEGNAEKKRAAAVLAAVASPSFHCD